MKTIAVILFFIFILLWFGFSSQSDVHTTPPKVVTIEGCEYFQLDAYPGLYTLCHKGNCTNHIGKVTP